LSEEIPAIRCELFVAVKMSSLTWCKACTRGDWGLFANKSDERGAGDAKWAQTVPTESQISTESLTGAEISLRGWCWGQYQSQTQGFNLHPFSQWRLCCQSHCPKPVFGSLNTQSSVQPYKPHG